MRSRIIRFVVFDLLWTLAAFVIFFSQVSRMSLNNMVLLPFMIIGLVIAMFIPWIFFWVTVSRAPAWRQYVLENGKQAPAVLTGMKDTGVSFGRTRFIIQMQLQVNPPDDTPFEATIESTISRLEVPTIGNTYQVKYDLNDRSHIVLLSQEDIAGGYGVMTTGGFRSGPAARDVAQELTKLSELHQKGDLSDKEFEAAKQKLLS